MKRFYTLLKLEFSGLFMPLCLLAGLMSVMELVLFAVTRRTSYMYTDFDYIIDNSGIPIVFFASFVLLLALIAFQFIRGYMPSKSIYALLTLSVKREAVYLAKLSAAVLAALCIISVQLGLLILTLNVYKYSNLFISGLDYKAIEHHATLYLSLLNSKFLRIVFPPDIFSLIFSSCSLIGTICLTVFASAQAKAGKTLQAAITAACWMLLILFTFPLTNYKFEHSLLKLVVFIVFPFAVSIAGIRVFKSGEVSS